MAVLLRDDSCAVIRMTYNPDLKFETAPAPRDVVEVFAYPEPGESAGGHLPLQIIDRYVKSAVRRAITEQMSDGRWYAEIPLLPGVWAEGDTESAALAELVPVTEGWLALKIEDNDRDIPILETIDLNRL